MAYRSSGEPAAVDEQGRAGHVGGVVADEEQARLRLLFGGREAAEGMAADELGLRAPWVRLRGDPGEVHRGRGRTGAERVDADAVVRELERERPREAHDGRLRRRVGGGAGHAD